MLHSVVYTKCVQNNCIKNEKGEIDRGVKTMLTVTSTHLACKMRLKISADSGEPTVKCVMLHPIFLCTVPVTFYIVFYV